ncbi:MAG: glutamate 5-kinase [Brevundimonas sp.]|nr:glutamate 5-kinase [Brevundimonas sp.]MDI1326181.1 glutamate 5-kinase [Brevundimonas sp.]
MPEVGVQNAGQVLDAARRVVVKIGSSLLVDSASGDVDKAWLDAMAGDVARLRTAGKAIIVVSSGAVALGRRRLGLSADARLDEKQAAAAVGQSILMQAWSAALTAHDLVAGQVLLTREDTERRRRWLNARATLEALLTLAVVPVVNENDTVATEEIRYGDNDRLAARTAQLARADLLVLLSDVDGLYTADPRRDPGAIHIPFLADLTPEALAAAEGPNSQTGVGSGGMVTKLMAARIARSAGCSTLILSGAARAPLSALERGARATLIAAPGTPMTAYKQWIAGSLEPAGVLVVDDGAAVALARGKSLLASGVSEVRGDFDSGDCVRVVGPSGPLGMGLAAYAAGDCRRIQGRNSRDFEALLGWKGPGVAIHRDDLVLTS